MHVNFLFVFRNKVTLTFVLAVIHQGPLHNNKCRYHNNRVEYVVEISAYIKISLRKKSIALCVFAFPISPRLKPFNCCFRKAHKKDTCHSRQGPLSSKSCKSSRIELCAAPLGRRCMNPLSDTCSFGDYTVTGNWHPDRLTREICRLTLPFAGNLSFLGNHAKILDISEICRSL